MSIEMNRSSTQDKTSFVKDLSASLVVFLVALPLCMGIALASGMPAAAGLVTGVIGGVGGWVPGGFPVPVSGPAAGVWGVVFSVVGGGWLGAGGAAPVFAAWGPPSAWGAAKGAGG